MSPRPLAVLAAIFLGLAAAPRPAAAVSPQNPYRSFNLSGINYGSMQWERAHRAGSGVVPSAAPPARRTFRRWRR